MTAQQLDLLDDGRRRISCPRCWRLTCLTPLGRIWGHGRRDSPCRGSWLTEREARRDVRLARGGRP